MRKIIIGGWMVLLIALSSHAWAANYSDPVDGVFRGVTGDTITVEVPSLVSKSPAANDQDGNLSFQFNNDTAYKNFSQLTDLKDGDPVSVEYTQDMSGKEKQMVATSITKIQPQVVDAPVSATEVEPSAPAVSQQTVTTTTTTRVDAQ